MVKRLDNVDVTGEIIIFFLISGYILGICRNLEGKFTVIPFKTFFFVTGHYVRVLEPL